METIFKKSGYHISNQWVHKNYDVLTVLQINNFDGSPRWIWNANNDKPLFLKFYNVGSVRAFLFAVFIKLIFACKLQKWFFKKQTVYIKANSQPLFNYKKEWAIFTGIVGINNKAIIYDNDMNQFIKVATTPNAEVLLQNECKTIERLNRIKTSFVVPHTLLFIKGNLTLTDVSKKGIRLKNLTNNVFQTLVELYEIENCNVPSKNWEYLNQHISNFKTIQDKRIPKNIIRKIELLLKDINPNETINLSFSHGDFTQWNMYQIENKIAVYDWELASNEKPKGYDFFHFIIQNDVLAAHKSWKEIYKNIINQAQSNPHFYKTIFNESQEELNNYLKWYLLVNCLYYLDVYAAQKEWHIKIYWLLKVWNEALNMFLNQHKTSRQLLVMDLCDMLHNKEYAALKSQNGFNNTIIETSDVDLVISKELNREIMPFLSKHALVSKVKTTKKSFINSVQIITHDAQILSLNLI